MCVCVCVCLCVCVYIRFFFVYVFPRKFNVGIQSFQMDSFLDFLHQNLYANHLYFLRATCFTQHFHLCLITRKSVKSENHEAPHHENSTCPPLLRPSQAQKKVYFVEIS